MGSTVWFEIQGRPLKETAEDCSKMHRLSDDLDALALQLGVRKLSDFFNYSELSRLAEAEMEALDGIDAGFEDDPNEEFEIRDPCAECVAVRESTGEWFDPVQVLKSLAAFRQHLEQRADALEFPTPPSDVPRYRSELLDELRLGERLAADAVSSGRKFRLLLVP